MRRWVVPLSSLALVACRSEGSGGEPAAAGSASDSHGSSAEDTAGPGGAEGDEAGTGGSDVVCPAQGDDVFVDPLAHLGRAQGDTFIEILDVVARDGLVFACTATQGLTIWDASTDPAMAELLVENVGPGKLADAQFPRCQHLGMDFANQRAVVTNRGDEIQPTPFVYVYDISDPRAPQPVGGWSGSASIEGVVLDSDRIYAAAHTSGILVFDLQDGGPLVQVGGFADDESDAWAPVLADDGTLWVAEGVTGLRGYDISGDDPVLLSTLPLSGSSKDVIVHGTTAYVAASSALHRIDVTSRQSPVALTETATQGTALALSMGRDGILFVAEWDEVRGYDAMQPEMPAVMADTVPRMGGADFTRVLSLDAEPDSGHVYVGEWQGMHAYQQQAGGAAPDITASPQSVQFGTVAPGDFDDRVLVVTNAGDRTLDVYDIVADTPGMTADPPCLSVAPGEAAAIEVRYEPRGEASQRGALLFTTNDPDEPVFEVGLSGNITGLDIGDPAPEFTLSDLQGQQWTLSELRGSVVVLAYFATF